MANGHGGYRRPSNPAPVSGPGAKSQRTDGGPSNPVQDLPNAKYGENTAYRAAEAAAPMSPNGGGAGAPMGGGGVDTSGLTPLGAPTARPEEPISAGMPFGAGPGPSTPQGPGGLSPEQADRLRGYLPVLVILASQNDADPSTRQFVTQLRAELG